MRPPIEICSSYEDNSFDRLASRALGGKSRFLGDKAPSE
jgi:hypothetical protein